ncbi:MULTISPECIES: molybdate ABC transporter substrate-binding protein [unclassified Sporosarcina]|uniref:molybdate ABC transporter substrate-binding protein n=1 Tax=unclassified Sporosarcina TaxID=2647733 RepID=UPI000C165656|nr:MULTISPECIES: molybdate ABC transporter substrate-binding protein [unclassified Sporosarcina]PID06511.1 molybdate ABC transporter substrate-binding protein [Sporosarcina sp. P30]PID09705.1 molybdate ABC transporter substrate-binding protein [Sporosarcina sp. P31]PID13283.1 molybdate ABC transporter substrate-binding protein [Sporosarcina sp. P32b]
MKRFPLSTLFISLAIFLVGCSNTNETEKTRAIEQEKPETELIVSAAASLTDALEELKGPFEEAHEGITVTYNFGSSGKLATTIENGAPSDVFLSASSQDMNNMEDKSLIVNESRIDFAENALVFITHKDSDSTISSFEDIDPAAIDHIAVGEPESVPVGRYTKETFERLDLWDPLQDKLVLGSDVRQVLTHVEMGNVDYGVVYSSDAFISDNVKVLAEATADWHEPIVYPAAVVAESNNQEAAQQFLDYLTGDKGEKTLQKFGFK